MKQIAFLICLLFVPESGTAQNQAGKMAALQKRIESIEKSPGTKAGVDVSKIGQDSGFEMLATFAGGDGKVLMAQNSVKYEEGGGLEQKYFFDQDILFAVKNESHSINLDGSQRFASDTTYFDGAAFLGMEAKEGQFKKGEAVAEAKLKPSLLDEFHPDAADASDIYQRILQPASQIKRLVKALSNFKGTLPGGVLLETISPNSRFLVSWRRINPVEEARQFSLFDLVGEKVVTELPQAIVPGANHVFHSSAWSEGSEYFAFINDIQMSTESAPLIKIDPVAGSAEIIGDLYKIAGDHAWAELKKAGNPFTKNREVIHGFVKIQSLGTDGTVRLLLDSQSEVAGPEHNVSTLLTISFANGAAKVTGFRISTADEDLPLEGAHPPGPSAKVEGDSAWEISATKMGPITGATPFDAEAVRGLFPLEKVEAGTETFEEGGEQPVIYVKTKNEVILTLVPDAGKKGLSFVYTNSPVIATQSGTNVGDSYGEVFEKVAEGTVVEALTGDAVVNAPGMANVTLRFSPSDPNTEAGVVPPFDQLKRWTLHTIEWVSTK